MGMLKAVLVSVVTNPQRIQTTGGHHMRLTILFLVLISPMSVLADGVTFVRKPTVKKADGTFEVSFTMSQTTDVEAAIVGKGGRVVRHLAAGVIGAEVNPPPPLKTGLSQTLVWDRKDDKGKPAGRGPFTARVRAGLTPKLGRMIANPAEINPSPHYNRLFGLATDEGGRLYVASGSVYSGTPVFSIKVYDRQGAYVKTIMPIPPNLKPEEIEEFGDATLSGGLLTPANHHPIVPYVQPGGIVAFLGNQVRDGGLWLLSTEGKICQIDADTGRPIQWKSGPTTYRPSGGPMCWAVAPDNRTLFLSGHWNSRATRSKGEILFNDGIVYAVDPTTGKGEPLINIDVPDDVFWKTEFNGWYHFKNWGRKNGNAALHGMAVDTQGRLYVCDRVNQRLAVYDKEAKLLGSTAIEWPDLVTLSANGSVYVSTRRVIDGYKAINEFKMVKLSSAIDGEKLAEITFTGLNAPLMALDTSGECAVVWLSNVGPDGSKLVRIEDHGDKLVEAGGLQTGEPFGGVVKVWVEPNSDDVYLNDGWSNLSRYDGLTGEGGPIPIKAMDMAFDDDGRLYLYGRAGWREPIYRCDREFNPVPFSATGEPTTELTLAKDSEGRRLPVYGRYGTGWSNKGIDIGPDGRMYVRCMYDWNKYFVTVFKPDGTAEKHDRIQGGILGPLSEGSGGIRIDRAGFFYVGTDGFPAGTPNAHQWSSSIVKVKPSGGGILKLPETKQGKERGRIDPERGIVFEDYLFEGAVTAYPRMSPRQDRGCVCKEARFDIDQFGRLYVPDVLQFCIHVYDNQGNWITDIGHYGNCDAIGKASGPPIPFGWPMSCSINNAGRLYVADVLNHRVVRVDPLYAAEAECGVPVSQ